MRRRTLLVAQRGVVISAGLGFGAMLRYPGGNPFDLSAARYSLTRNFLSDLGMTVAFNGQSNRLGAAMFATSLLLLVGSSLIIVAELVGRLASTSSARRFAQAAGLAGIMASASFVVVALATEDRALALHVQATLLAFRLLPLAVVLLAAAAWSCGERHRGTAKVLTALATVVALYAVYLSWGPSTETLAGLRASVIAQKVVAVAMMTALCFLSTGARHLPSTENASSALPGIAPNTEYPDIT